MLKVDAAHQQDLVETPTVSDKQNSRATVPLKGQCRESFGKVKYCTYKKSNEKCNLIFSKIACPRSH